MKNNKPKVKAADLLDLEKMKQIEEGSQRLRYGRSSAISGIIKHTEETRDNEKILNEKPVQDDSEEV